MYKAKFLSGQWSKSQMHDCFRSLQRTWKSHNKLNMEQLKYAGVISEVEKVGFYHGGDVLRIARCVPASGTSSVSVPSRQNGSQMIPKLD